MALAAAQRAADSMRHQQRRLTCARLIRSRQFSVAGDTVTRRALEPDGLLLSVVIPTYNRGALATRAVQSVLTQSNWDDRQHQLIVVDDGSTDETPTVLEQIRTQWPTLTMI